MKYLYMVALFPVVASFSIPNNDSVSKNSLDNHLYPDRRSFLGSMVAFIPSCAIALTPQEASRQYDTYAPSYNELDGGKVSIALGIEDARRELIQKAKGDVLEIGVGTGTQKRIKVGTFVFLAYVDQYFCLLFLSLFLLRKIAFEKKISRAQSGQVCWFTDIFPYSGRYFRRNVERSSESMGKSFKFRKSSNSMGTSRCD